LQETGFKRGFDIGCPRQIRGQTTTLLEMRITVALPHGLRKVTCSNNGRGLVSFFGSKAFVRSKFYTIFATADTSLAS
jgi:hypothetical protein